jgi:hypothetical protein
VSAFSTLFSKIHVPVAFIVCFVFFFDSKQLEEKCAECAKQAQTITELSADVESRESEVQAKMTINMQHEKTIEAKVREASMHVRM